MGKVTFRLILDSRHKKDDKGRKFPVLLRVTHNRKQQYLATGHSYSSSDWEKMYSKKPGDLNEKRIELGALESKAKAIKDKLQSYSFDVLKSKFSDADTGNTLKDHFNRYIKELWNNGQVKTATNYQTTLNSLQAFDPNPEKLLSSVSIEMLRKYQAWMVEKGNSLTAVSIYTRCLRTIINKAIASNDFSRENYPFGRYRYLIPNPRSKKETLSLNELIALNEYKSKDPRQEEARDMWLFSYYCAGRNPIDICKLKYEWIKGNYIEFPYRSKTLNTAPDQEPVIVEIHEDIQKILDRWAQKNKGPESYVFDVLKKNLDAKEIADKIALFIRRMNNGIEDIAKELKFHCRPTMGCARCTMANNLQDAGVSIELISQNLGHQNIKTSRLYLKSIKKEMANEALSKLRIVRNKTT